MQLRQTGSFKHGLLVNKVSNESSLFSQVLFNSLALVDDK